MDSAGIDCIPAVWAMPQKGQRGYSKGGVAGTREGNQGSGSASQNLLMEIQELLLRPAGTAADGVNTHRTGGPAAAAGLRPAGYVRTPR